MDGDRLADDRESSTGEGAAQRSETGPAGSTERQLHQCAVQRVELELQNAQLLETRDRFEQLCASLEQTTERYHSLFLNMLNGFAHCRIILEGEVPTDYRFIEVNPAFERLTGFTGVAGRTMGELFPDFRRVDPDSLALFGRVARTGVPERWEGYLPPLKGWFSLAAYRPAQGEFVAILDNVTGRKMVEQALLESENRHQLATAVAKEAIWDVDFTSGTTRWNRSYATMFNRPADQQHHGKWWLTQIHPEDRERVEESFAAAVAGPAADWSCAYRMLRADGRYAHIRDRALFVRDAAGRAVRAVGAKLDVTEQVEAEREIGEQRRKLRELAFELQSAEERERTRIAGELHDQVGQRLLLGKLKLDALASRRLPREARREAEEIAGLMEESIQDIRCLTFQMSPPLLATVGLVAALRRLCSQLEEEYALRVELKAEPGPLPLRYEFRSALYHAVRELLLNVVKHAGTLEARLGLERRGDELLIEVVDQGAGFSPTAAPSTGSRCGGFGLFHIQQKMEYLGGSFSLRSSPGQGSRATIVFPLDRCQEGDSHAP